MQKPMKTTNMCPDHIRSLKSSERSPSRSGKPKKLDLPSEPDGVRLLHQAEQALLA